MSSFSLQVSESVALEQAMEAAAFPLDLDEETITLMMVNEHQTYEKPPSVTVIEEVWAGLSQRGQLGKEVVEEVPEPFSEEVPSGGDHEEHVYGMPDHGRTYLKYSRKLKRTAKCNFKLRVFTKPPSIPLMVRNNPFSSPPKVSHVLPAPTARGSTSSSCHYSVKSAKTTQN